MYLQGNSITTVRKKKQVIGPERRVLVRLMHPLAFLSILSVTPILHTDKWDVNLLTPPRCLHGVVEFNSFNDSTHHVNSDDNIWWLIELPYWFEAYFLPKISGIFTTGIKKIVLVVAGAVQLNVVYSKSVKLNLREVISSNVIIYFLLLQCVGVVFKNTLCCWFIEFY